MFVCVLTYDRARSLRANLVQCSDLGRSAFREAESKLSSVSMAAQKICEPNGTVRVMTSLHHKLPG